MGRALKFLAVMIVLCAVALGGYFWVQGREPDDQGFAFVEVERGRITEKAVAPMRQTRRCVSLRTRGDKTALLEKWATRSGFKTVARLSES